MTMTRSGRKRKSGYRHACGKLVTSEKPQDARAVAMEQPHRRWGKTAEERLDARCESPFGLLSMHKVISPEQYLAGTYYAQDFYRYRATLDLPPTNHRYPFVTMDDYDPKKYGELPQPEITRLRMEMTGETTAILRKKYDDAFIAAGRAGNAAARAVSRMCCHREPLPDGATIEGLIRALDNLVAHYEITPRKTGKIVAFRG